MPLEQVAISWVELSTPVSTLESGVVPVSRIRRSDPGCKAETPLSPGADPSHKVGSCLQIEDRLAGQLRHAHHPGDPTQFRPHRLVVVTREVVAAADGWPAAEGGMGSV